MADINLLTHQLRFYVADINQPYQYQGEELRVYLLGAARRLGLEDKYPTWADFPSFLESLCVKIGYLNFFAKKSATVVQSSDVRVEDLQIGSSSGSNFVDLYKQLQKDVEGELAALGLEFGPLEVGDCLLFDRQTHTKVPYEAALPPETPLLSVAAISAGKVTASWTHYGERDFWKHTLESSSDAGVTWTTQWVELDNHNDEKTLTGLPPGSYLFRVTTTLNSGLYSTSDNIPVTVT